MKVKVQARSFAEAFQKCPWATDVTRVKGGYMCSANETVSKNERS